MNYTDYYVYFDVEEKHRNSMHKYAIHLINVKFMILINLRQNRLEKRE